jgi:hypothetical protein
LEHVSLNKAPTALDLRKRAGTSTVARTVSATTGPTPVVVIRRRHTSSDNSQQTAMHDGDQLTTLIDAEEALSRDPFLRWISKRIVDVGDPINLYVAVHVAVPVNMNI